MADDNTSRSYRSNDPYRRGAQGSGEPPRDPLAELARLIGQPDPFADYGRDRRPEARPEPYESRQQSRGQASDWRRTAAAMPAYETFPEEPEQEPVQRYREEEPPRWQGRRPEPYSAPSDYERRDPYHMAAELPDDPPLVARPAADYRDEPQYDDPEEFRRDDREYAAADHEPHMREPYFEYGSPMTQQDDDIYDDPPRPRRRGGLITAVTLIGCAMIGTAGAYGYRTYYVAPNGKVPPVITAETTPNKVVSAGDIQTGKIIQDRVGDPVQAERLVSREEQPVMIPPGPGAPRVVLPGPGSSPQSAFPPPPSPGIPSVAGRQPNLPSAGAGEPRPSAGNSGEPRRVRTVTIRPEGNDAPTGRAGGDKGGAAAAPRPAAKSASAGRNSAPPQLDPETSAQAQPAPSPRSERVAAVPPTTQSLTPPAPRAALAPANGASSGNMVQVSSQRSEAEAQASFRALQGKYPDQLAGQSMIVRRVDLGDKGIYYRAMIGPFASSGEAVQFCSDLKAAGGQCLVPRN